MSFDPEKVARLESSILGPVVLASDYNQLLALYRTLHGQWRELRDGIDHLHFQLHAQEAPPDTDLPTIEEMCGLLDRPQ